jgi:hypothetical protein
LRLVQSDASGHFCKPPDIGLGKTCAACLVGLMLSSALEKRSFFFTVAFGTPTKIALEPHFQRPEANIGKKS